MLKTMFYPVDVDNKIIYIDPMKREREIADKWIRGDKPCIGIRGDRLLQNECYRSFQRRPTVTKATLLFDWKGEASTGGTLWQGAATNIVSVIESNEPEPALAEVKRLYGRYRHMAISTYYERAIRDLKTLISQQAQLA
jgi:hypothetical protein